MKNIEWQDKFSVHVDEMDRHHKKLLGYLNEMQSVLASEDSAQKLKETILALIEYSEFHFTEEERLLKAIRFPGLEVQINQHSYFINEIREMRNQLTRGTLPGQSVIAFLRDWFTNHIMQEDIKYGNMLQQGKPLIQ